jgi:thioredoxin reductase (NADPH)
MALYDLQTIAFPTLDEAQIAEIGRFAGGEPRLYRDGETLVAVGQRDFGFFLVKSGAVAIIDYSGDEPRTVVVHQPGQFTGEVSLLVGSRAMASAVAQGDTEVYELSRHALKRLLNERPALSDILLQAFIARRQLLRESPEFTGLRVIGSRYSTDTFRIRDFLAKNRVLFTWLDLEVEPHVDELLKQFGITEEDTPVVACGHKLLLRNPSNRELADAMGIHRPLDQALYDLVIVGAGPAGLAAGVYGASEGLRTAMLERTAPGGQAGSSMRIENYLGFPMGLTGSELTERAIYQTSKFGARLSVPTPVTRLEFEEVYPVLHVDGGESITAKCLLIAVGVDYRRLGVEGCEQFEGRGVYYAAGPAEAEMCAGSVVIVVGGGNSAGQAAVFLSQHARQVLLLIRGDELYKSMSSYLVHRIEETPNIELRCGTTIQRMEGDGHLGAVSTLNSRTGQERTVETPAVFSFIGAVPRTDWLPPEIERDAKGFVRTGPELAESPYWTARRPPFLLETSHPGVFAAGDVRSGSAKRVASAVGEGAMAVMLVHEYMKGL